MGSISSDRQTLLQFQKGLIESSFQTNENGPLPGHERIQEARAALVKELPETGLGDEETLKNLEVLKRGFDDHNQSTSYYGFVTGGITPVAAAAETLVSVSDQNLSVALPQESIATRVESSTLKMLCELFDLDHNTFKHRTFTTGATASNVLGLACGREYAISSRCEHASVGQDGIVEAMRKADLDGIQVLAAMPHSSVGKAASIVGLGRASVLSVGKEPSSPEFDFERLSEMLQRPRTASIVIVSCAEINTGFFATGMKKLRALCDQWKAHIHVDGGKSIFQCFEITFLVIDSVCQLSD